jgi:hypothetical protein
MMMQQRRRQDGSKKVSKVSKMCVEGKERFRWTVGGGSEIGQADLRHRAEASRRAWKSDGQLAGEMEWEEREQHDRSRVLMGE